MKILKSQQSTQIEWRIAEGIRYGELILVQRKNRFYESVINGKGFLVLVPISQKNAKKLLEKISEKKF